MHILHVAAALKGGPLSVVADLVRYQVAAGHRVSLVYSPLRDPLESFRGSLAAEVEFHAIEIPREIHPLSDYRACRKLTATLRDLRPDVIHLHSSKAGAIGRIAAKLSRIPAIYSPHGISYLRTDVGAPIRAFYFTLEWVLGLFGALTVACSDSELNAMKRLPGRKTVIPNGIDLNSIPATPLSQPDGEFRVALCGRITAQKNPGLAARVAENSPPDWRWMWLGDGELRESASRAGRIQILGWMRREEVLSCLGTCDVLVHTSSWEGMPIAILESMAMALPVVATDIAGNRDLIVPGETGFIASDVPSFLSALKMLADSKDLCRRMGLAGQSRVVRDFDQTKLASRWMELYRRVHQRKNGVGDPTHATYRSKV